MAFIQKINQVNDEEISLK